MQQYQMFELMFQGEAPEGSHVSIDLEAVFEVSAEDGTKDSKTVKGFYAGNGIYKVRFYPGISGEYTCKVRSEIPLKGALEGAGMCEPAAGGNHGMMRAVGTRFEYDDTTLYHPFGTTIYALAHQEKERIEETYKTTAIHLLRRCRTWLLQHKKVQLYGRTSLYCHTIYQETL